MEKSKKEQQKQISNRSPYAMSACAYDMYERENLFHCKMSFAVM